MRFFVLGPRGSNSDSVAQEVRSFLLQHFCFDHVSIIYCSSITDVLYCAKEHEGFCVVPVENTLGGIVDETIRFWLHQPSCCPLHIVGEWCFPVRHHLLMRFDGDLSRITEVWSHPQALSQCRETIQSLIPNAVVQEQASTAGAAKSVSLDPSLVKVGVIASEHAADEYGLQVVHPNVHDCDTNMTRFHIVAPRSYAFSDRCFDSGKTVLLFRLPNKPNTLVSILSVVGNHDVNLSSIRSISLGVAGEYAFYCEFDSHVQSPVGAQIVREMRAIDDRFTVLGSF